jgi:hypothetical protein
VFRRHRQQAYALHAGVMREVDHVGDVLEVDVSVATDEGYFLGALQIDFREAGFEIFPAHAVLIDLYGWGLIVLGPHYLDDDSAGLHNVLGLLLIGLRNLRSLALLFVHRHDHHEDDDQREQHIDQGSNVNLRAVRTSACH